MLGSCISLDGKDGVQHSQLESRGALPVLQAPTAAAAAALPLLHVYGTADFIAKQQTKSQTLEQQRQKNLLTCR
jgi:hypothetical protein